MTRETSSEYYDENFSLCSDFVGWGVKLYSLTHFVYRCCIIARNNMDFYQQLNPQVDFDGMADTSVTILLLENPDF